MDKRASIIGQVDDHVRDRSLSIVVTGVNRRVSVVPMWPNRRFSIVADRLGKWYSIWWPNSLCEIDKWPGCYSILFGLQPADLVSLPILSPSAVIIYNYPSCCTVHIEYFLAWGLLHAACTTPAARKTIFVTSTCSRRIGSNAADFLLSNPVVKHIENSRAADFWKRFNFCSGVETDVWGLYPELHMLSPCPGCAVGLAKPSPKMTGQDDTYFRTTRPITARPMKSRPITTRPMTSHPWTARPINISRHGQLGPWTAHPMVGCLLNLLDEVQNI
jgi:hypothetical protein